MQGVKPSWENISMQALKIHFPLSLKSVLSMLNEEIDNKSLQDYLLIIDHVVFTKEELSIEVFITSEGNMAYSSCQNLESNVSHITWNRILCNISIVTWANCHIGENIG